MAYIEKQCTRRKPHAAHDWQAPVPGEAKVRTLSCPGISESKSADVERAIDFAVRYGQIDGDHHKLWVIDQMLRALTGCPVETVTVEPKGDRPGYTYERQGTSPAYLRAIGDDPEYPWDAGIAP